MITLTPSLVKRKHILKEICKNHSKWKLKWGSSIVLLGISLGILVADGWLLVNHPTSSMGVFVFICAGIGYACIPFAISLSIKNSAKYKCCLPYSSYANGTLILGSKTLEYVFWRVGPHEPAAYSSKRAVYKDEDKFIYRINKDSILSINLKNDICYIRGNGKIEMPEWAIEDETVKVINKEFSFVLAFEQENITKLIEEWRR